MAGEQPGMKGTERICPRRGQLISFLALVVFSGGASPPRTSLLLQEMEDKWQRVWNAAGLDLDRKASRTRRIRESHMEESIQIQYCTCYNFKMGHGLLINSTMARVGNRVHLIIIYL
ncbi:hypothetical protein VPH35_114862 [Triticum aestivum]